MRLSVLISVLVLLAGFSIATPPPGGIASCVNITASGSYFLLGNLIGSPNPNVAIAGSASCIRITSSNVVLDCMGFSITKQTNLSVPSGAIVVDNLPPSAPLTNITVKNCAISGFDVGIAASVVNSSLFQNNTVWNGTLYGIGYGTSSLDSAFIGNTVHDISRAPGFPPPLAPYQGFFLSDGVNGTFVNNTAYGNLGDGFHLDSGSDNNSFSGNTAYGNARGFYLHSSGGNNLSGNSAFSNSGPGFFDGGFYLDNSDGNNLAGNIAHDDRVGIFLTDSDGNTVSGSQIYSNIGGLRLQSGSDGNGLTLNTIYNNSDACVYLLSSSFNNFTDNYLSSCPNVGLIASSESSDIISGNNITNMTGSLPFLLQFVSSSAIRQNNIHGNSNLGLNLQFSPANNITGNSIYNNSAGGLQLLVSNNNNISGNTAYSNGGNGFAVLSSSFVSLDGNSAYQNSKDGFLVNDSPVLITSHNSLSGNTARNNSMNGFHLFISDNNNLSGNTAYGNARDGFFLEGSNSSAPPIFTAPARTTASLSPAPPTSGGNAHNNLLAGNTAYQNAMNGFELFIASNNSLSGNTAYSNSRNGFLLHGTNSTSGGSSCGNFICEPLLGETFITCPVDCGISVKGPRSASLSAPLLRLRSGSLAPPPPPPSPGSGLSTNNSLIGNIAHDNADAGYLVNMSRNTTFLNNTAYQNAFGIYEKGANVTATWIYNSWFYGNGWEIAESKPFTGSPLLRIVNSKLGSGSVNISLNDTLNGGYQINDTSSPGQSPENRSSFAGKYLKVNFTGEPAIDSLAFHWSDLEASGQTEDSIQLYTWNMSGWLVTPGQALAAPSNTLSAPALSNITADDIYGLFILPPQGGGENSGSLSLSINSSCSGNTVTVRSSGSPIAGIDVKVDGDPIGPTDGGGKASFDGCGKTVTIHASGSGYYSASASAALLSCAECLPACANDSECPSEKSCTGGQCIPVSCPCGVITGHACLAFGCCSDSMCPSGQACSPDHKCKESFGCTSDAQCKDSQACDIPPGAAGGACRDITGQCGAAKGHRFVPYGYECGNESGCPQCPQGRSCVEHKCLSNDITCPSTAVVGDNKTCLLTENDKACGPGQNCTAKITTPDGREFDAAPDENGNVQVPASISGKIKVTLLKDGKVVKEVFINVLPRSASGDQGKPAVSSPLEIWPVWLLIAVILVILAFLYYRRRKEKK
ncbi:MAG: right-handed parallel beta-helix repeat-containing protein [Candidatus Micrarchaeia archaeon]